MPVSPLYTRMASSTRTIKGRERKGKGREERGREAKRSERSKESSRLTRYLASRGLGGGGALKRGSAKRPAGAKRLIKRESWRKWLVKYLGVTQGRAGQGTAGRRGWGAPPDPWADRECHRGGLQSKWIATCRLDWPGRGGEGLRGARRAGV